jgi:hypothetical protein
VIDIKLPPIVRPEQLAEFVRSLGVANSADEVRIDFSDLTYLTPGAIAALVTKVHGLMADEKNVFFTNHQQCVAFKSLKRIKVFSECGIPIWEESGVNPKGNFVPLSRIGKDGNTDVAKLSTDAAFCIAPELADADPDVSGPFDCVEYSISEMVTNVQQHSGAYGFITAQYLPDLDITRLAIADCGRGILASFRENGSAHWREGMDDLGAILKALEPQVSSRSHLQMPWGSPVNAGVGLTLLRELAKVVNGEFLLLSGMAAVDLKSAQPYCEASRSYSGVVCEMGFARAHVTNFFNLLNQAKRNAGLLSSETHGARFE